MNAIEALNILRDIIDKTEDNNQKIALTLAVKAIFMQFRDDKFKRAQIKLSQLDAKDPEYKEKYEDAIKELEEGEHEYLPINIGDMIKSLTSKVVDLPDGSVQITVDKDTCAKHIHVFQDDGMGYGAVNALAFSSYMEGDEFRIWM
jgi:hypothetical protein